MIPVSSGTTSCSTAANSCPSGMDIFVLRSRNHLISARSQFGDTFVGVVGVSRPADGCGTCTSYAMNSVDVDAAVAANSALGPAWEAIDGGSWYIRATIHSEPNGDYSSNGWLDNYWLDYLDNSADSSSGDIGFNDGGAQCKSSYLCSTNAAPTLLVGRASSSRATRGAAPAPTARWSSRRARGQRTTSSRPTSRRTTTTVRARAAIAQRTTRCLLAPFTYLAVCCCRPSPAQHIPDIAPEPIQIEQSGTLGSVVVSWWTAQWDC